MRWKQIKKKTEREEKNEYLKNNATIVDFEEAEDGERLRDQDTKIFFIKKGVKSNFFSWIIKNWNKLKWERREKLKVMRKEMLKGLKLWD